MGNVGNIEKVMVFGILLIIVGILGIAIWGNNSIEEPRVYQPVEEAQASDSLTTLTRPLNQSVPFGDEPGLDSKSLIQDDNAPFLRGDEGFGDPDRGSPVELSTPRPQAVDDRDLGSGPVDVASAPGMYTVKKNDTFGSIAKQVYGSARYAVELQKANEDVDPRRMHIGQVLNLPRLAELDGEMGRDPGHSAAVEDQSQPLGTKRTYEVKKGDTLFGIARAILGGSGRWREIFEANQDKLKSPNDLKPGMLLILPER